MPHTKNIKDMKKIVFAKVLVLAAMLMGSASTNAQINLGNILSGIAGKDGKGESSEASSASGLLSGLTSIFSKDKQASTENIVGTWEYSEPAITFESDNLLTKAGAGIASNKLEEKLQEQLSKIGIDKGAFTITFNEDGTFTETFGEKSIKGKWKVEDSKLNLVFGQKAIPINTQLNGNKLMIVTDATKILDLIKGIASKSSNSNIQTISTLMKGIDGMNAGLTLVKK